MKISILAEISRVSANFLVRLEDKYILPLNYLEEMNARYRRVEDKMSKLNYFFPMS